MSGPNALPGHRLGPVAPTRGQIWRGAASFPRPVKGRRRAARKGLAATNRDGFLLTIVVLSSRPVRALSERSRTPISRSRGITHRDLRQPKHQESGNRSGRLENRSEGESPADDVPNRAAGRPRNATALSHRTWAL
jgi:hypothetical protein